MNGINFGRLALIAGVIAAVATVAQVAAQWQARNKGGAS